MKEVDLAALDFDQGGNLTAAVDAAGKPVLFAEGVRYFEQPAPDTPGLCRNLYSRSGIRWFWNDGAIVTTDITGQLVAALEWAESTIIFPVEYIISSTSCHGVVTGGGDLEVVEYDSGGNLKNWRGRIVVRADNLP